MPMMNLCPVSCFNRLSEAYQRFATRVFLGARHNVLILLFVLFYISSMLFFFGHAYFLNDEFVMMYDIQKGYETTFMSVILGKVLSFFYLHVNSSIPWYGLFLYTVHALSLFLFIRSLFKIEAMKYWLLPFLLLYLLLYAELLTTVSYTATGIMLGSGALFALLIEIGNHKTQPKFLLLGFCLALCFLIRIGAFVGAVACAFPLIASAIIRRKALLKPFISFLIPLFLVVLVNTLVLRYGVSREYARYQRFNELRYRLFHEYPISRLNENNTKLFEVNHWTPQDYLLLNHYNIFSDERKFNVATMENIFKYSVRGPTFIDFLKDYFNKLRYLFQNYQKYLLVMMGVSILLMLAARIPVALALAFYLVYILSGMIAMFVFCRFPFHIARPICIAVILFLPYFALFLKDDKGIAHIPKRLIVCALSLALAVFFCVNAVQFYRQAKDIRKQTRLIDSGFNKVNAGYPNTVFFLASIGSIFDYVDSLKVYKYKFEVIPTGWKTFSPAFYDVLKKELGIEHAYEILPNLIDNPRAFVLASEAYFMYIFAYFREIYHLKCRVEKVDTLTDSLFIYRLESSL